MATRKFKFPFNPLPRREASDEAGFDAALELVVRFHLIHFPEEKQGGRAVFIHGKPGSFHLIHFPEEKQDWICLWNHL